MRQGDNNFAIRAAFLRRRSRGACSSRSSSAPDVDGKTGERDCEPTTTADDRGSPQAAAAVPTSNISAHDRETSSFRSPLSGEYYRAAVTPQTPADSTRGGVEAGGENGLLTGFARQVVMMMIGSTSRRRPPATMVCDEAVGVGNPEAKAGGSSLFNAGSGRGTAAAKSIAATKGRRSNEDRFIAIVDLFRVEATTAAPQPSRQKRTPPPSPSPLPSPSPSEPSPTPQAGASTPATPALVSATVGDVGVYGVFDGHGGKSCADFVSRNLPQAIRESPAWARLVVAHGDGDGKPAAAGAPATSPPSPPPAPGGASTEGAEFEELLRDVMTEALLDGFEKTQEGALAHCGDSGATAVVALAVRRQLVIANLGDSGGVFHVDRGTAEEGPRTTRTECHTVENPAERNRVEAAGGSFSGGRLFGRMQPTRSFGDRDIQRMQEGALIAVPEVTTHQIMPTSGSAFLVLGTDGLWEGVKESKVVSVVRAETNRRRSKQKPTKTPLRIAEALAQRATKASEDDITAVVVLFQ